MEFCGNEKLTEASLSTVYEKGESSVPFANATNAVPAVHFSTLPTLLFSFCLFLTSPHLLLLPFGRDIESEAHEGMIQREGG